MKNLKETEFSKKKKIQARKLEKTTQLFFHCCHHTCEENTACEMIF